MRVYKEKPLAMRKLQPASGIGTRGEKMVNLGDVGRICLNQEMRGVCKSCLWWEWDAHKQRCTNSEYNVCPLYREQLFNRIATTRLGQTLLGA